MRRRGSGSEIDAALVAVCTGDHVRLPDEDDAASEFVEAARHHRIGPLAHVRTRDTFPDIAKQLQPDRDEALHSHLWTSALLPSLGTSLEGIRWVVFKGPVLSEFAHPIPGLRFYKDMDLLVSPKNFAEACRRLLAGGWQLLVGDDSLLGSELAGEVPLVDRRGVVLDLHWSMVVTSTARRRFMLNTDDLLARARPRTLGPAEFLVLSPSDALVHVCQHAALVGATRLGHVLDADQLARQVEDWDDVAATARAWGAGVHVAAVLGRARRVLGTPVPRDFERRLGVSMPMASLLSGMDRLWPVQSLRSDESWLRLFTRALRPGVLGTAATVVRRTTFGVLHRLRPEPVTPREVPSQQAIDTFLSRVTAAAGR